MTHTMHLLSVTWPLQTHTPGLEVCVCVLEASDSLNALTESVAARGEIFFLVSWRLQRPAQDLYPKCMSSIVGSEKLSGGIDNYLLESWQQFTVPSHLCLRRLCTWDASVNFISRLATESCDDHKPVVVVCWLKSFLGGCLKGTKIACWGGGCSSLI